MYWLVKVRHSTPEGDHGGPKWASFDMLFGLYAPPIGSFILHNMNVVYGCKIWSLPIGRRVLNLLWRAPHYLQVTASIRSPLDPNTLLKGVVEFNYQY